MIADSAHGPRGRRAAHRCRRGATVRRTASAWAGALTALLLAVAPAGAQSDVREAAGLEISPPVQQSLLRVQELWLQWVTAFYQNAGGKADDAAKELASTARQLGLPRLPDLALGMAARGVESARRGNFERAHWSLASAERLDPGRPETAFAEGVVARLEGSYPTAIGAYLRGVARALALPLERKLLLGNLMLALLCVLLATGAAWLALQVAVKGGALYRDLHTLFVRRMVPAAAHAVCVLALLWPLAVPSGVLWLLVWWSILLWGYGSPSERAVQIALWALLALVPVAVHEQQRTVAVLLSPPMRAMQNLERGRLYGGLFIDLGVLRTVLPESAAVKELIADVHRTLGQWEYARSLYRQVLESEPGNVSAMLNLGAYYFEKSDFASANQYFQRATTVVPPSAAAYYDLSLGYGESYLFEESKQALAQARAIDNSQVSEWVQRASSSRVLTFDGGLARRTAIRRQLLEVWRGGSDASAWREIARRMLSLPVMLGVALAAFALHLARRRNGYSEPVGWLPTQSPRVSRWIRTLVPAAASVELGDGGQAFALLFIPVALLLLPWATEVGYRVPWGFDPGRSGLWVFSALGLVVYLVVRLRRHARESI